MLLFVIYLKTNISEFPLILLDHITNVHIYTVFMLLFLPSSFLLADRGVFSIPVAMTLLASFISPITLLGIPAEIYVYGGLYLDFLFSQFLLYPSIVIIFVPVFYGLKLTSAYEVSCVLLLLTESFSLG